MAESKFSASNETAKLLVDLLESQLGLQGQSRVVIYNQKWHIPEDEGLYVVVRYLWSKPFGCGRIYSDDLRAGFIETLGMNMQEHYSVEVLSRGSEARVRKHEVLFAFNGTEAQQMQEANSLKLGNLSTAMRDTSYQDGSAIVYRYAIELNILRAYEITRSTDYFDKLGIPPEIHTNP